MFCSSQKQNIVEIFCYLSNIRPSKRQNLGKPQVILNFKIEILKFKLNLSKSQAKASVAASH